LDGASSEDERFGKPMAGELERAERDRGEQVPRLELEGLPQHPCRREVVRRIARVCNTLLVLEAAHRECASLRESGRLRLAVGFSAERPAEEKGGGGQGRHRPAGDEPFRRHHGFCSPLVFS